MDREEKRLEVALDVIRQQIALATAIIGAVVAFADPIAKAGDGKLWRMLPWALTPLVVSIVLGVIALMGIGFHLKRPGDPLAKRGVRLSGMVQNVSFLVAMILLVTIVGLTKAPSR
jgi:hypothetical protein